MRTYLLSLLVLSWLCGCTSRPPVSREESIVLHEQRGCVLTILLDLSGSFHDQMIEEGKAHQFCVAILDSYFKDRIGEKDEIVIAQISGSDRALLWQGTPMQLRRDFRSPEEFGSYLRARAVPSQSNVFASLAQAIEYVASDPDVISGHAKSAVIVLSDMLDNDPHQAAARERLRTALEKYSTHGGVVGCYYVDQQLVPHCREFLAKSGLKNFTVQAEFVGNPQLPALD